jgi:hypothetical protein
VAYRSQVYLLQFQNKLFITTMFASRSLLVLFLTAFVPLVSAGLLPKVTTTSELKAAPEQAKGVMVLESAPQYDFEQAHRHLVEDCALDDEDNVFGSCVFASLFDEDAAIYSDCGGFAEKNDQWCRDEDFGEICCGSTSDCCDAKVGAIVGVVIAIIVVLTLSILGCCYCCKCCCCYEKFHGGAPQSDLPSPAVQGKAEATAVEIKMAAPEEVVATPE